MRDRLVPWIVLAMLCVVPGPASAGAHEAGPLLRLTEVLPSPDAAAQQREFVEVQNAGPDPVDLAGWRLRDAPTASNATNEYTFPAVRLAPGERIVVWSNGSADGAGLAWSASASKAVWNDAGDAATLLDPSGQVRDWVGYGSTAQPAPPGHAMAKPAAPARGKSIQEDGGTWTAAAPTPGLAPGQQGGTASARVANVPPTVTLDAPATVRPGETVAIRLTVTDGNGDADVASWELVSRGAVAHRGNASFSGGLVVAAPLQPGTWTLVATALDAAGGNDTSSTSIEVRTPKLAVALPPGGALRFPQLRPGDHNVTSLDAFTVRNDGGDPATPRLDVSAFRAGAATIPVDGNLWVGALVAGNTTWLRYDGPLQPLPTLAPGEAMSVQLRIGAVPVPAAAGTYGTTFTVVA